jgi:hypothetical protein
MEEMRKLDLRDLREKAREMDDKKPEQDEE